MKNNFSSPTFFALGFAWAFYSPKWLSAGFHLLFALGAAALFSALSRPPSGIGLSSRAKAFLFAAAAGIASGASFGANPAVSGSAPAFGLPPESVSSIEGVCADDSRFVSSGRTFIPLEVRRVRDSRGNSASAGGRVTALSAERLRLFWGKKVELKGRFVAGRGEWTLFIVEQGGLRTLGGRNPFFDFREKGMLALGSVIDSLGAPGADLFEAVFLGRQDDVLPSLKEAFVRAGVVHILALSGMHLALLAVFISVLLSPVGNKSARDIFSFVLILAYVAFVGPKPSILRAAVMYIIFFLLRLLRRNSDSWAVLVLSFIVYAAARTGDLDSLSFQLSYLAMAGIILFARNAQLKLRPYLPEPLLSAISLSLAAQLATSPVLAVAFGVVYPSGIVSTLLVGPLMTLYLWTGLVACLLHRLAILRPAFAWSVKILYTAVVKIVETCAGLPAWRLDGSVSRILFWGMILLGLFILIYRRRDTGKDGL